jgi:hypothetical protein
MNSSDAMIVRNTSFDPDLSLYMLVSSTLCIVCLN